MKFSVAAISFQILLVVLFASLVKYDPEQSGPVQNGNNDDRRTQMSLYPSFQDVHVMIFIGIGFLIIFLRKYGYSSVGYNFFLGAIAVQWYIIVGGCFEHRGMRGFDINLDLKRIIRAEFAAAVILISFGVVLGKVNRLQILVICIIEIVMYSINEFILFEEIQIADAGASMGIHIFACYFGLALSFVMRKPQVTDEHPKEVPIYHSDVFAMIGSLFLWAYWPTFNSILVTPGNDQQRAAINTYLSLASSCVTVFAISSLVNKGYKLNMAHVQNATLAGGVAIGTTANMLIGPWAAILIGFFAGLISVLGFKYVSPFLNKKIHLHDTCGVHNLHGMPGLLAAIAGVVATSLADRDTYKESLANVFPAVGKGRSISKQAGFQALAIVITLAISMVSGAITGLIVKQKIFDPPTRQQLYDDEDFWEVPKINQNDVNDSGVEMVKPSNVHTASETEPLPV